MFLNLGCGLNKIVGAVNVDCAAACVPDIVWDLEDTPWPFESGCADRVALIHVLEHLGETTAGFMAIMKELYRVCAPGAEIKIVVPHPRSDHFLGDPTHVRPINPDMMALFSKESNRRWAAEHRANSPLGLYCDVDFTLVGYQYALMPHWAEKHENGLIGEQDLKEAIATYNHVVSEITIMMERV